MIPMSASWARIKTIIGIEWAAACAIVKRRRTPDFQSKVLTFSGKLLNRPVFASQTRSTISVMAPAEKDKSIVRRVLLGGMPLSF